MTSAETSERPSELDLVREFDEIGEGLASITPFTKLVAIRFEPPSLTPRLPITSTKVDFAWYPKCQLDRQDGSVCIGGLLIDEVLESERKEQHTYRFAYRIDNGRGYSRNNPADIQTATYRKEKYGDDDLAYWGDLAHRRDGIEKVQRCLEIVRAEQLMPGLELLGTSDT
jgi:hypothetical protein